MRLWARCCTLLALAAAGFISCDASVADLQYYDNYKMGNASNLPGVPRFTATMLAQQSACDEDGGACMGLGFVQGQFTDRTRCIYQLYMYIQYIYVLFRALYIY